MRVHVRNLSEGIPMPEKKDFKFLEHTADVYIAAYGGSIEEAFENAALATTEVMTDADQVKPETKEKVEIEARDMHELLYNWIEELLFRFDAENNVYSRFQVSSIEESDRGLRLRAEICGEVFDPESHPQKLGVKAITYHQMEIKTRPDKVTLKFVLDV